MQRSHQFLSADDRRPSVVYEEDFPILARRGSVTMTLRITSEEDAPDAEDELDDEDTTDEGDESGLKQPQLDSLSIDCDPNEEDNTRRLSQASIESSGSFRSWSGSISASAVTLVSSTSSCNTLKVPGLSSNSSIEELMDPKYILRHRAISKARSTDSVENNSLNPSLHPSRRYSTNSYHYYENFIKGRRSSYGPSAYGSSSMASPAVLSGNEKLRLMARRRLSDQVRS
ncbi:uncharacterized protein LOC131893274 [Tigriopus californicus]|uniref:uncharacterized protein LOC131893274 n=1 Tax=Tigriopus californicus TaxID=6832 RepID=UPI0027D9E3C7|nr:uncharacterized protein LOC131893274 [Tigriopus californicus]XP_059099239.1 uncharacterized protein LOC131893274 [Tigriopus californicus]